MLHGLPKNPKPNVSSLLKEPQMTGLPGICQEQIQVICGGTYFKSRPQRIPTAKVQNDMSSKTRTQKLTRRTMAVTTETWEQRAFDKDINTL